MFTPATRRATTALTALTAVSVAALALSLAGCSPASTTEPPESASEYSNLDDWSAAFNSCLREQGMEITADGAWVLDESMPLEEVNAAVDTCTEEVGAAPGQEDGPSPEEWHRVDQALIKCLREKGYDVADVKEGEAPQLPNDVSNDDFDECNAESLEVLE